MKLDKHRDRVAGAGLRLCEGILFDCGRDGERIRFVNDVRGGNVNSLEELAGFIKQWNAIGSQISAVTGRPALPGHIAEFVAATIFDIELLQSASQKGIDGYFKGGSLTGKSVNIKFKAKNDGNMNLTLNGPPDVYLVLAGPRVPPISSRGTTQPWVIDSIFLFDSPALIQRLIDRKVKIGDSTSVVQELWRNAQVYPESTNETFELTTEQRHAVGLFAG